MLCQVFKSDKHQEMYLYVEKSQGVAEVPESLMQRFGEPQPVMLLKLEDDTRLARANAEEVLAAIREGGFYLQMPPTPDQLLQRERASD